MNSAATTETGRQSSEKLYREEQEMQTSNEPVVAGFVEPRLEVAQMEAAPHPGRLGSGKRVSEVSEVAACPWRVQPRRRRRRKTKEAQETALNLVGMEKEVAS